MKFSDNPTPSLLIVEGTIPSSPSAGRQRLWVDSTTKQLKFVSSAGTQTVGTGLAVIGCSVYNSAAQTMNGSGTNSGNTLVTFDSESFDTNTMHSTVSATQNIVIPFTGKYQVGFELWGTSGAPATGTVADIWVDGATPTAHRGVRAVNQAISIQTVWHVSTIMQLTAAQTLSINVNNPNASTFTIGHASAAAVQSSFWAYLIGV